MMRNYLLSPENVDAIPLFRQLPDTVIQNPVIDFRLYRHAYHWQLFDNYAREYNKSLYDYNRDVMEYNEKVETHNKNAKEDPLLPPQGLVTDEYNEKVELHNTGYPQKQWLKKRKKHPLRADHRYLFVQLILKYQTFLNNQKKKTPGLSFKAGDPLPLSTNREQLRKSLAGKVVQPSLATMHRHLVRLTEAGVITEKIYHGPLKNFEIKLNPELLLVTDANAANVIPGSLYLTRDFMASKKKARALKTRISDFYPPSSISKCNPNNVPGSSKNIFNNIIITPEQSAGTHEKKEFDPVSNTFPGEHSKNPWSQNTEECGKLPPPGKMENLKNSDFFPAFLQDQEQEKEKSSAKKEKSPPPALTQQNQPTEPLPPSSRPNKYQQIHKSLDRVKQYAVNWILGYLLAVIFENHTIYEGEKKRTREAIYTRFFKDLETTQQVLNRVARLYWSINKARDNIKSTGFVTTHVFPFAYVTGTCKANLLTVYQKWWKQELEWQRKRMNRINKEKRKDKHYQELKQHAFRYDTRTRTKIENYLLNQIKKDETFNGAFMAMAG